MYLTQVSHLSGDGRAEGLPSSEGDDITASKKVRKFIRVNLIKKASCLLAFFLVLLSCKF